MVHSLVQGKIKEELGLEDATLHVSLYKMLLYEEVGHFTPHTDTEKEKGMVATLIFTLSSKF